MSNHAIAGLVLMGVSVLLFIGGLKGPVSLLMPVSLSVMLIGSVMFGYVQGKIDGKKERVVFVSEE